MPMSSVPARQLGSGVALGGRVLCVAFSVGEGDLGTAGGGESERPGAAAVRQSVSSRSPLRSPHSTRLKGWLRCGGPMCDMCFVVLSAPAAPLGPGSVTQSHMSHVGQLTRNDHVKFDKCENENVRLRTPLRSVKRRPERTGYGDGPHGVGDGPGRYLTSYVSSAAAAGTTRRSSPRHGRP